jgi:acetylornithine/succinyldiaminopimelate/putrescine aminotransferase
LTVVGGKEVIVAGELIAFTSKAEILAKAEAFWNPDKTRFWSDSGIPLVIGEREGYVLRDVTGKRLVDVHLNGGTYNLGHRNPEIIAAVTEAMEFFDIGNHHFPSVARTALAQALIDSAPPGMTKVMFGSGGGEAIDIALKSARHATGRRVIVSIEKAYHGHTGLAVATGDDRFAALFLSDRPGEFVHVPFNDLAAMEAALQNADVAAVIMETIPATYGFPLPAPGYLRAVKELCERYGTLYIADEVQTGLMRTGELWGITKHGVRPDLLVTGKGLSGGMYPISAVLATDGAAAWLTEDGFAHMSTFGGAEVGCVAALRGLEITRRPEVRTMSHYIAAFFTEGLAEIRDKYPDWFTGVRQDGLVMGLEFGHPEGAKYVMRRLYERGVWAIFSTLDPRVLQYKPGLLLDPATCEEILDATEAAIGAARDALFAPGGRPPGDPPHGGAARPPIPPAPAGGTSPPNAPSADAPLAGLPAFAANPAERACLAARAELWAAASEHAEPAYPVASNMRDGGGVSRVRSEHKAGD